jgi:monoterpene epsilon-lactone hydrolase
VKLGKRNPKLDGMTEVLPLFDSHTELSLGDFRKNQHAYGTSIPLPEGFTQKETMLGNTPAIFLEGPGTKEDTAILFFHSGGYCSGGPADQLAYAAQLCEATKVTAFVLDYRIAPENPFPAAYNDSCGAYAALLSDLKFYGGRIVLAGDSSGGAMAVAVAQYAIEKGLDSPGAVYAVSPWADLTQSGSSYKSRAPFDPILHKNALQGFADAYLAGADPTDRRASPVFGSFENFPPVLIDVGADEVLLSDAVKLAECIALAGSDVQLNVWKDMIHIFPWFATQIPEGRVATERAGRWLRSRLGQEVDDVHGL